MSQKSFYIYFALAGILGAAILTIYAFDLPSWSEEHGWLTIGKSIAAGQRLNPIAPKSDYPSSFQAFPIGGLIAIGLQPLTASRMTGLLYAIGAAYFFGRIALLLSKGDSLVGVTVMLVSLVTYNTALYILTGWHEVTHVNLLCGASTFFLLSLLQEGSRSSSCAVALGISLGISLWTLYSPALSACAVILVLCVIPSRLIPWRLRLYTFGALGIAVAPLLIGLVNSNWAWLQRHYLWFVEGGEWANVKYSPQNPFWAALLRNLNLTASTLTPQGAGDTFESANGVFPEWTLAAAAIIGVAACFRDLRAHIAITIPFVITSAGLILSNPKPWRLSILGFFVLLFAALGLARLGRITSGKPKIFLYSGFLILHLYLFIPDIERFTRTAEFLFADGRVAEDIASTCEQSLRSGTVLSHDHHSLILLQGRLSGTAQFKFYPKDTDLDLVKTKDDTLIALSEEKNQPQDPALSQRRAVCSGTSHGLTFRVIKDQHGSN